MVATLPVLILFALLRVQLSTCSTYFVMLAPNILRVENEETIIIQAHEYQKNKQVDITVFTFPGKNHEIYKTSTELNETNNYVAKAHVKIPFRYYPRDSEEKQYVVVQAKCNDFDLEKAILVSPNTGYIFIQTDKPIYTPNQRVNYRVFSTNHDMNPVNQSVLIHLQNPDGIIVSQDVKRIADGFASYSLLIPELVIFGNWKIVVKNQDTSQETHTAEFEVKEYVLPVFEVELTTEQRYFYHDAKELTVHIKAKYLYGEPVEGHAVALFGIYNDFMTTLQDSLQRVEIRNGIGEAKLYRKDLDEFKDLYGASIYANVTVFSTGGDYVQAQKTGIKIVSSPYNIVFIRTPHYFKPGMPFKFGVYVTNPDSTPAARVSVFCQNQKDAAGITSDEGLAFLTVNSQGDSNNLIIQVSTDDKKLQSYQQANATMTATAYKAPGIHKNFLHIDVKTTDVTDALDVTLNIKSESNEINKNIKYFTILVVNKGKIVQTKVQKRTETEVVTALRINVTPDLQPSFRIIVYFYLFHPIPYAPYSYVEIVADSVWVHMKRSCIGTLNIQPSKESKSFYEPQQKIEPLLTGDKGARVGLVIVDKAVYVLNNKTRFTQNKIWDAVDQNDIGCTAGSGADYLGVFQDAGLDFTASHVLDYNKVRNWASLNFQGARGLETTTRKDFKCSPGQLGRRRRSIKMLEAKQKKVNESPDHLKPCCEAGWHESPMGLSCSRRKEQVRLDKACADLFYECCQHAEELRSKVDDELIGARLDEFEDDTSDDVKIRTYFPESWSWHTITLPGSSSKSETVTVPLNFTMPDSITTWVLQAISINQNKGVCVADPYEILVYKSFFVDLRLPYSVIRNEQVQIRAVIYNYESKDLQVVVTFPYKESLCSLASKSRGFQQTVKVDSRSSKVVNYVIIPLEDGNIEIEVKAQVRGTFVIDAVRKTLTVLPEGKIQRIKTYSGFLKAEVGEKQVINIQTTDLENMVPSSIASNFISIQGDILGETLLGTLDSSHLRKLIYLPTGCPEQNMIATTPNVIVTRYLDSTSKWELVGAEKRKHAINFIKEGYKTQLGHRMPDHSFQHSTWLTAYVVKIFAMASSFVYIDEDMLCNSSLWLVGKQQPNGEFTENGKVFAKAMQGGYAASESSTSLTAFVLIALVELGQKCPIPDINKAKRNAEKYLENQLPHLKQTYSAVLTSYALALVRKTDGLDIIDNFASKDKSFWPYEKQPNSVLTVEATGYALLQKLKLKKFDEAHKIAEWLVKLRHFGGGYISTQATVIAMQALAQYEKDIPKREELNLNVELSVEGRAQKPVEYTIRNDNAFLQRTNKAPAKKHLTVTVSGTGTGTITVMTVYNSLLTTKEKCSGFELSAVMEQDERNENTYKLIIRTRYTGDLPATMTIIDITMLTGFYPNKEDLKQLTNNVEKYILQFETDMTTTNGSVVIYLTEVSNKEDTVIGFRVNKNFEVGLLQPADITIYEYYDPDKKCSTFYNTPDESGLLRKLCTGSSCKCAAGKCGAPTKISSVITSDYLFTKACEDGIDYVFKVILKSSVKKASYDYHTVEILDVMKQGEDDNYKKKELQFISHAACGDSLQLEVDKKYLIMNHYSDLWTDRSVTRFVFTSKTYFLIWPEENERQEKFLENLNTFTERMTTGCDQ
ncbi:complement C3-like [Discoglossus pictus]